MRKLITSLISLLLLTSCSIAYPNDSNPKSGIDSFNKTEFCAPIENIAKYAALNKLSPIFISGSRLDYAMIVYVNLKTEYSLIVRVNKDMSCIVGKGSTMILKFPQGIQEI